MTFKVGDVCVVTAHRIHKERNGLEVTILAIRPNTSFSRNFHGDTVYRIDKEVGTYFIESSLLRLRRPPSWDSWLYDVSGVKNEDNATPTPNRERV